MPGRSMCKIDFLKGSFEEFIMAKAKARHILVPTEKECLDIKKKLESGGIFSELAKTYSKCPSAKQGGTLGEFSPGEMVDEFDAIVFKEEVGKIHGPVKTEFGYHLIQITKRTDD
jgi:peptidyl-prolyl cis-trans isomerase C